MACDSPTDHFRRAQLKPLYAMWYLAGRPEEQVSGVLESDEKGHLTLTLNGVLGAALTPRGRTDGMLEGRHRLVGDAALHGWATLEDCFVRSAQGTFGPQRQVWHVGEVLCDVHFDADEPWTFCGIRYRLPLLTHFARLQNVKADVDWDETKEVTGVRVEAGLRTVPLWNRQGMKVSLGNSVGYHDTEESIMEIESRVDLHADASERIARAKFTGAALRPVQLLIGLASGCHTSPVAASVVLQRSQPGKNHAHALHFTPLDLTTPSHSLRFGFYLADVQALGTEKIDTWMERLELIGPVIDLYLAALRELDYAELAFTIVLQALETYHRRTTREHLIAPAHWDDLCGVLAKEIAKAVTDETSQEFLSQRLAFLNEASLAQRLKALLKDVHEIASEICGGKIGPFVSQVTGTRNYFTHWDPRNEARAVRSGRLVHLTSRLMGLLELRLLQDLGFAAGSRACEEVLRRRVRWLPKAEDPDG